MVTVIEMYKSESFDMWWKVNIIIDLFLLKQKVCIEWVFNVLCNIPCTCVWGSGGWRWLLIGDLVWATCLSVCVYCLFIIHLLQSSFLFSIVYRVKCKSRQMLVNYSKELLKQVVNWWSSSLLHLKSHILYMMNRNWPFDIWILITLNWRSSISFVILVTSP